MDTVALRFRLYQARLGARAMNYCITENACEPISQSSYLFDPASKYEALLRHADEAVTKDVGDEST